jgi:hypothetical protein
MLSRRCGAVLSGFAAKCANTAQILIATWLSTQGSWQCTHWATEYTKVAVVGAG